MNYIIYELPMQEELHRFYQNQKKFEKKVIRLGCLVMFNNILTIRKNRRIYDKKNFK